MVVAQLPGDDVARVIVEDGGQVKPSPADDLQVSEVGLPELVRRGRLIHELIRSLNDDMGWTGDEGPGP